MIYEGSLARPSLQGLARPKDVSLLSVSSRYVPCHSMFLQQRRSRKAFFWSCLPEVHSWLHGGHWQLQQMECCLQHWLPSSFLFQQVTWSVMSIMVGRVKQWPVRRSKLSQCIRPLIIDITCIASRIVYFDRFKAFVAKSQGSDLPNQEIPENGRSSAYADRNKICGNWPSSTL